MRLRLSVALLILLTTTLGAQSVRTDSSETPVPPLALVQPTLRERAMSRVTTDSIVVAPVDTPSAGEVFGRIGAGALGATLGALGGGLLGYAAIPHSDCDCDDPGLREFLIGAAIGTVAGAALAAALPRQHSDCGYGRRVAYGVAGALAGGVLGLIPQGDERVLFVPIGAVIGAGVASAHC